MTSSHTATGVLEFLCNRRFHRRFALLPNPDTGRSKPYNVSYADYGDSTSNAVVLFCGGLMGTRLSYSHLDQLAKAHNVRIIHPDRPGIGGSDPVELDKRIETWLEMVPQLLIHLNVSHVSLASHSWGTIYILNTLLAYPHLLHPQHPYVCYFAPWVHPAHSKVAHLQAAQMLPAPMIGKFASLAKFINRNVTPLAGMSGSLMHSIKGSLPLSNVLPDSVSFTPNNTCNRASSVSSNGDGYALDLNNPSVIDELRKQIITFVFAESMDGVSGDTQLCLKKPRSIPWCSPNIPWSDIDAAVPLFSRIINEDDRLSSHSAVWTVNVFHAEVDNMVGEKGKQWFDDCWTMAKTSTTTAPSLSSQPPQQRSRKSYEFKSQTVQNADHDYLMDSAFGASETWLQRVRDAVPVSTKENILHCPP
ncbi:hypothetical protein P153DRAFT_425959 [Dothidotthia symphoricarpi CBS 119687]|uniref:AB hydrolase-1 domain-containing protein n=1 Tax=Dothidotthia symphoricarpi CBS 119687 TaxID=1392245 RepID=A0A6A6A192_9PLEO|nr:uncharacterized protein P153DRAFT_425959 [Dothidotthia symphoricarpi CBS 119687]KAF2125600.1 hypothetical protein P153DRAFT_425959 [Dothidotthia symphoricarpi CBS 119687]